MNLICLDYETYFSDDYTLKKLTTEAYIRDPRFEALGCAVSLPCDPITGEGPRYTSWWGANHLHQIFDIIDWRNTAVIAHHAHFDGLILSHHFGIKPAFWFDTLSMARLIHGNHLSVSLASLAKHYNLKEKNVPYDLFRGKRWNDLNQEVRRALGDGCCHDVSLTYEIFSRLLKEFPAEELSVVDATVRMFTEPSLVGDAQLFAKVRDESWQRKNEMLYELGVGEKDLASADKFVRLLEAEGIEVPLKKGKERMIPAVASTDQFMRNLADDPNERVAALAEARLEVKSTIGETRAGRLAAMSERGPLSVYLSYCGAHTTRWSGGDRVNFQNFPRGSDLRKGLRAPEGYLFGAVDQSQGECRILNWLAGQWDVVERFRLGNDPYIKIASEFYGFDVTKENPKERGTGKQLELSCGYMAGAETIRQTARRGTYGPPVDITLDQATFARNLYRNTHKQVVELWKFAGDVVLHRLWSKDPKPMNWGPMIIKDGKIYGPSGAWIDYTSLKYEDGEWRLHSRNGYVKTYSGKIVQNVIELLSRTVTSQAMIKIRNAGIRVVGMAHDDLWMLIADGEPKALQFCIDMMAMTPSWAPGLPLGAEGHLGVSYGG